MGRASGQGRTSNGTVLVRFTIIEKMDSGRGILDLTSFRFLLVERPIDLEFCVGSSRKSYLVGGKPVNENTGENFDGKDITTPRHETSRLRLRDNERVSSSVKRNWGLHRAPGG